MERHPFNPDEPASMEHVSPEDPVTLPRAPGSQRMPVSHGPKVILNIPTIHQSGMTSAEQVAAERRKREEPTHVIPIAELQRRQAAMEAEKLRQQEALFRAQNPSGLSKSTTAIIAGTVGAICLAAGIVFGVSRKSPDFSTSSNNSSIPSGDLTAVPLNSVGRAEPVPTPTEVPTATATALATATAAEMPSALPTVEPSVEPLPEPSAPATVVAPSNTNKWTPKTFPSTKPAPSQKPLPGGIMRDVPF